MAILPTSDTPTPVQNGDLPAAITMDWETFYGPGRPTAPVTLPEPAGRAAFRQAVAQAATARRQQAPQLTGQITKAVQIVLAGDIEPGADGKYIIGRQADAGLQYVVDGVCACKDTDRPEVGGGCKHVLAAEIFATAYAQTAQTLAQRDAAPTINLLPTFEDVVEESRLYEEKPAPTPALPEAPYSASFKAVKNGFEVQITVRKAQEEEFLQTLATMPQWLAEHGYQPTRCTAPAASTPPSRADTVAPTQEPSCRYHGTQNMKPSKFGEGRYVCSVKLSDGSWCNQGWPAKAKG